MTRQEMHPPSQTPINPLGAYYRSSGAFGSSMVESDGTAPSSFSLPPPPPPFQPNLIIPPPNHSFEGGGGRGGGGGGGDYSMQPPSSFQSTLNQNTSGSSSALFNLGSLPQPSLPSSLLSNNGPGRGEIGPGRAAYQSSAIPGLSMGERGDLRSTPSLVDLDPTGFKIQGSNSLLGEAPTIPSSAAAGGGGALPSSGSVRKFGLGIARRSSATAAANAASQSKPGGLGLGLVSGSMGDLTLPLGPSPPLPHPLLAAKGEEGANLEDEPFSPNGPQGESRGGAVEASGPVLRVAFNVLLRAKGGGRGGGGGGGGGDDEMGEGEAMDVDKEEVAVEEEEYISFSIEILGDAFPLWNSASGDMELCAGEAMGVGGDEEGGGGLVMVDSNTEAYNEVGAAREEEDEEDEGEEDEEDGEDQEAKARRRAAELGTSHPSSLAQPTHILIRSRSRISSLPSSDSLSLSLSAPLSSHVQSAAEAAPLLSSWVLGNNIEALETIFMDLEKLHLSLSVKGKQNRVQLMMLEEEEEEVGEEAALLEEEAALMAEETEAAAEFAATAAAAGGGGGGGGEGLKEEGGGGATAMDLDSSAQPLPDSVEATMTDQHGVDAATVKEEGVEMLTAPPSDPSVLTPPPEANQPGLEVTRGSKDAAAQISAAPPQPLVAGEGHLGCKQEDCRECLGANAEDPTPR